MGYIKRAGFAPGCSRRMMKPPMSRWSPSETCTVEDAEIMGNGIQIGLGSRNYRSTGRDLNKLVRAEDLSLRARN